MKEVHKTLAVLVYWTIAAVAYGSDGCIHGDIRLKDTSDILEVCIEGNWTSVCNTGGWHSRTLDGMSENTRVACRQLGYSEEGATFSPIHTISSITETGLRQDVCSGSELQLIDCPAIEGTARCHVGTRVTCQPATCTTTIRLRGGSTATEGRVEVCRDGQWGTVCDDSWDRNDATVACRQLGHPNFSAVAVSSAYFGPGSGRIHLSNLQCNGSEATLTDCTFSTPHQCSHNQDANVICINSSTSEDITSIDRAECVNDSIRLAYETDTKIVEFCSINIWNMCNDICQDYNAVSQLGTYFCGLGGIAHFLMNGSQQYKCPISGVGEFLICEPTVQTLANNCQQVLPDIELQASSSSITVTWGNADNTSVLAEYEVVCLIKNSILQASKIVDTATSEVTMENLPHSTTYECCVTLHIGRYSTRACGNTSTLAATTLTTTELPTGSVSLPPAKTTATGGGAATGVIALGVLVAVLVLLLVLVTGACLYLLIMRVKSNGKNGSPSSTNQPQEHHLENPEYTPHSNTNTDTPTPAAPPHTLTFPPPSSKGTELTEFDSTYSAIDAPIQPDLTYDIPGERPAMKTGNTAKKPIKEAPLPAREGNTEEGVGDSEYSALNRPDLVYAVVEKKAKKKKKQVKIAQGYEVPQESPFCQEEYSRLQHGKY